MEKQRDILKLFIEDKEALAELGRKLTDSRIPKEDWLQIMKEFGPKARPFKPQELAYSDNYVRDKAGLGSDERKQYIDFFLTKGYLVRNDEGSLEITSAGTAYCDDLNRDLERPSVKSLNELSELSRRRKDRRLNGVQVLALVASSLCL